MISRSFSIPVTGTAHWESRLAISEPKSASPRKAIPSKCKHTDILKNIMVNCKDLQFSREYLHVRCHQDDKEGYTALCRPAQLNCWADFEAKAVIWGSLGSLRYFGVVWVFLVILGSFGYFGVAGGALQPGGERG